MKKIVIAALGMLFLATGCSKVVPVKQNEIGVHIDGSSNEWEPYIYSGNNIKLSYLCSKNCDDAHIFEGHHQIAVIEAEYAMPQSNDLDLTLGINIKVTYDRSGGDQVLRQRLKQTARRYLYSVRGEPSQNQIFRTTLSQIIAVDLSEAQVKSKVRPILEPFDLSKAYYNIAKGGSIVEDIRTAIEQHLKDIGSPLKVLSLEISKIAQPEELLNKKKQEESMESEERIHKKKLDMKENRMLRQQLIRMKEASNELELYELNRPYMTPESIAYKWTQVAQSFAEQGIPFAVTPEMLIPAISVLPDSGMNPDIAKSKLAERIAELESKLEAQKKEE